MKTINRLILIATLLVSITLALSISSRGGQGIGSAVSAASPVDGYPVYLPMLTKPSNTIYGHVTDDGNPAANVTLVLWRETGVTASPLITVTTNLSGDYTFQGMPALGPDQAYWVRYENDSNSDRLAAWYTRQLTSFPDGSMVNMGSFDIANVVLTSPPAGTKIVLPTSFQWTPRPATMTDSYQISIFDYFDGIPYYDSPLQGYTGSYNLSSMPAGFQYCNPYFWGVTVNSPDGGYGISYWAYLLSIHQSALAGIHGCVTENGVPVSGIEVDLFRWTGSTPVYLTSTTTSNGYYNFTGQGSLTGDDEYFVDYWNETNTTRLREAWTNSLTSYIADSAAFIGDFDIKNIPLYLPGDSVVTSLPATFDWDARPNTLWDDYEFDLYDPYDGNLWFWTEPTLGYEDNYSLADLPPGFSAGNWYKWEVWVYDLWGGGGVSSESRWVQFSSLNGNAAPSVAPERHQLEHLRARERQHEQAVQSQPRWLLKREEGSH